MENTQNGKTTENISASKYKIKGWKKFWMATCSIVVTFGLLEIAARIYVAKVYGKATFGMMWKFSYEPYALTKTNDRLSSVIPAKGDAYRILLLGGSTADQVPDDILINAFSRELNREVEVINFGQGGHILNQEKVVFAVHGIQTNPDLVITLDGVNDIMSTSKTGKPGLPYSNDFIEMAVEKPISNGFFGLVRESQLINSLNKLRERQFEKSIHTNDSLLNATIDHVALSLKSISTMAHGCEVPHVMIVQPYLRLRKTVLPEENAIVEVFSYRGDFLAKGMRKLAEKIDGQKEQHPGDCYFVDSTTAFDDSSKVCFTDEAHLNRDGNEILWNYIVGELRKQNFFESHK